MLLPQANPGSSRRDMEKTVFNTMCTAALACMRFMSSQASDWLIPDSRIAAGIGGNGSERNGSERQWLLI